MKREALCYRLDENQEYSQGHDQIVEAYLKAGSPEFGACGKKYKSMDKGEATTFYDEGGTALFDVENARLSKEAAGLTKEEKGAYRSGEEKLLAEEKGMLATIKLEFKAAMRAQLDLIFNELISFAKQEPEFEKQVLLPHKSMERCMKFCSDKAMGLRNPSDKEKEAAREGRAPIVTPVSSDMLFEWIREYYSKDDKEEAKKAARAEKKDGAGRKQRKEVKKKAETEKKAAISPKEAVKMPATKKKEMENQLSLFDLMEV